MGAGHGARPARERRRRTSGIRRSSVCSSCCRRSVCSAVRCTCCSAPTSAPDSASSSPARASPASWCCSRACGSRPRRRSNSPKGRSPGWKVIEVVERPDAVEDRRGARHRRERHPVDVEGLAQLRPAIDAALVHEQRRSAARNRRAAVRGVRPQHRLPHRLRGLPDVHDRRRTRRTCSGTTRGTRSCEFCTTLEVTPVAGQAPPAPTCDPLDAEAVRRSSSTTAARCGSRRGLLLHVARAVRAVPARAPLVREGRPRTQEGRIAASRFPPS